MGGFGGEGWGFDGLSWGALGRSGWEWEGGDGARMLARGKERRKGSVERKGCGRREVASRESGSGHIVKTEE